MKGVHVVFIVLCDKIEIKIKLGINQEKVPPSHHHPLEKVPPPPRNPLGRGGGGPTKKLHRPEPEIE